MYELTNARPCLKMLPASIYQDEMSFVEAAPQNHHLFRRQSQAVIHVPKGEWYTWMTAPKPEARDLPAILQDVPHATTQQGLFGVTRAFLTDEEPRREEKQRLRAADRLVLIAVMRPDRLSPALDRLVESVLGPSFLQASSASLLTDVHESPEALFMETAKLSVAGVSHCAGLILQVSPDDTIDCLAYMRAAAAQSRAALMLRDISSPAMALGVPGPHQHNAEQQLAAVQLEIEHLLTHEQAENVWLVVKSDPLSPGAAETINALVKYIEHLRHAAIASSQAALSSGSASPRDEEGRRSRPSDSSAPLKSAAQVAPAAGRGAGQLGTSVCVWVVVDRAAQLGAASLLCCLRVDSRNVLGRLLGGGGSVPYVSVSQIAAELFNQLVDHDWLRQGAGRGQEEECWRIMASLCVMHSLILERSRFVGGWVQESSVMFQDFLAAVTSVRRALNIYETRGQQVDWKTVRGMVSLQYACLETNVWDSRVLSAILHKHLHRGILNARHEVLPGLALTPPPGRTTMLMSGIVKSFRGNANKDRIEILGLSSSTAEMMQHMQDQNLVVALSVKQMPLATVNSALVLCPPFNSVLTKSVEKVLTEIMTAAARRRRQGNINRELPVTKGQVMSLERQAEVAALAAQKKWKASAQSAQKQKANAGGDRDPQESGHSSADSVQKRVVQTVVVPEETDKDKDKIKDKKSEDESVDDLGGIRSARETRLIGKIRSLFSALPKPIAKTAYLLECEPAQGSDVMRQHLCRELESFNTLLHATDATLARMMNLLMGDLGSGAAAHLLQSLPDLAAIDNNSPPQRWLRRCPPWWQTQSLQKFMEILQAAHQQLFNWARKGCLRSYYMPVLMHPREFLIAVRVAAYHSYVVCDTGSR